MHTLTGFETFSKLVFTNSFAIQLWRLFCNSYTCSLGYIEFYSTREKRKYTSTWENRDCTQVGVLLSKSTYTPIGATSHWSRHFGVHKWKRDWLIEVITDQPLSLIGYRTPWVLPGPRNTSRSCGKQLDEIARSGKILLFLVSFPVGIKPLQLLLYSRCFSILISQHPGSNWN